MVATSAPPASAESGPRRSHRFAVLLAALVIVLAGIAAYANSFRGQFVFDDMGSIEFNTSIRSLRAIGSVLWGGSYTTVVGRPLLNASLAINYAWSGLDVWSYHVVNLAVHLLAALALFGVVRRTLLLPSVPTPAARDATGIALAVALLWTVHPLQTESVTYIVQRAESLVALFYLLTIYCTNRGATGPYPILWYALAIVSCVLGVASKEVIVTAPVVVLLYDRVLLSQSFGETLRRRWGLYVGLASCWGLLAWLMLSSGGRGKTAGFGYGVSPGDYALTQFRAVAGYLNLCFWPHPLIIDYGMNVDHSFRDVAPQAAQVACLLALSLLAFWRRPQIGFLALSVFIILSPTSSFVPIVSEPIAEHRMYLPLAAVVALAVIAGWRLSTLAFERNETAPSGRRLSRTAGLVALALTAVGLGYLTHVRNRDYQDTVAMWKDLIAKRPDNVRAYYSLGNEMNVVGDTENAILMCGEAIKRDPNCGEAYFNRGNAYALRKEHTKALEDYARALGLKPELVGASVHCHCGKIHLEMGQEDEALASFTKAVEAGTDDADCWFQRGMLLKRKGDIARAGTDMTMAIRLRPVFPDAYNLRGHCHKLSGHLAEAVQDYTQALRQQPNFADALNNRGVALAELGRPEQAIADFTRAIALAPDYVAAYKNRAMCRYDIKQYDQAWSDVREFERRGGESNPAFIEALTQASGRSR